ncbi:MAG: hypothetical protein V1772_13335 [Chloroflexota bacterium]
MQDYLRAYAYETVHLLADLNEAARGPGDDDPDTLTLAGYRRDGEVIAVQAFYRYGRWLPHLADEAALDAMLQDAGQHYARWLMGPRRMVDPIWERLSATGWRLDFGEAGTVHWVGRGPQRATPGTAARRATPDDAAAVARLRREFDVEYFCTDPRLISHAWCAQLARRYIARGAYVAEHAGRVVAMVATGPPSPPSPRSARSIPSWPSAGRGWPGRW